MSKIVSLAADLGGAWMSHRASAERLVGSIDQLMAPITEKSGMLRRERNVAPASFELLMGDLRTASADDAQRAVSQLATAQADAHVFNRTAAELEAAKSSLLAGLHEAISGASLSKREATEAVAAVTDSLKLDISLNPVEPWKFLSGNGRFIKPTTTTTLDTMAVTADANLRGWFDSAQPQISATGTVEVDGGRELTVMHGHYKSELPEFSSDRRAARDAEYTRDWPEVVLKGEVQQLKSELARTLPGGADALTHIDTALQNAANRDKYNLQLAEVLSSRRTDRAAESTIATESIREGFSQATELGHVREMLA